jgi:hypothetical protein
MLMFVFTDEFSVISFKFSVMADKTGVVIFRGQRKHCPYTALRLTHGSWKTNSNNICLLVGVGHASPLRNRSMVII